MTKNLLEWVEESLEAIRFENLLNHLRTEQGAQEFRDLYSRNGNFRNKLGTMAIAKDNPFKDERNTADYLLLRILTVFGQQEFMRNFKHTHYLDHFSCFDSDTAEENNGWVVGESTPGIFNSFPKVASVVSVASIAVENLSRASSAAVTPNSTLGDLYSVLSMS